MKQRVRNYRPLDARAQRQDRKLKREFDPNAPHEFEALFVMKHDAQPEKKDKQQRQAEAEKSPVEKQAAKGIER